MSMFPNGAVATPTHDPTPGAGQILFTRNSGFGEGFQTSVLNKSRALWPREFSIAKVISTQYILTIQPIQLSKTKIAYVRSKDGGNTWSNEVIITGPTAYDGETTNGSGGDEYAMAARGETVVIAYVDTAQNFLFRNQSMPVRHGPGLPQSLSRSRNIL